MNKTFASVALTSALLAVSAIAAEQTSSPVFSKDVAPILYRHCATCHRPGDIAPMPLLTYEQVRPWAKSIREKVSLGQMPPWHATQPRGTFLNDRRLTDAEKDTLIRWAKDGAPQGDPKDLPPTPTFTEGWEIGAPDVILSMAKSYEVPPSGTINYQYFTVPTNFNEDKWVQAIEVRPGTRSVVHHVLVFLREPGAQPRQNAFVQVTPPIKAEALRPHDPTDSQSGTRPNALTLAATTAPGTNAMTFRPGTAIRIKAGAVLVFQIHYTANGKVARDTTSASQKNRPARKFGTAPSSILPSFFQQAIPTRRSIRRSSSPKTLISGHYFRILICAEKAGTTAWSIPKAARKQCWQCRNTTSTGKPIISSQRLSQFRKGPAWKRPRTTTIRSRMPGIPIRKSTCVGENRPGRRCNTAASHIQWMLRLRLRRQRATGSSRDYFGISA